MMTTHNKISQNICILTLLIYLSACSEPKPTASMVKDENKVEVTKEQFQEANMEIEGFSEHNFHDKILINGLLDVPPEFKAAVSVYYGGYVKDISILPGQFVKKGEKLFSLENPDFIKMQQDYLESKGQLAYLQNDYERQKSLMQDKVNSEKEYLKSKAEFETTQARVASLKKQLQLINKNADQLNTDNISSLSYVRSPISGYINAVNAEKGKFLAPKDIAVSITNPDHIHVELSVYEKDFDKVSIGQDIVFQLQNKPGVDHYAQIYLISRAIEADQRVFKVHGHLKDNEASKDLIPGMYVEAQIITNNARKQALPEDAIVNIEDNYYVLLLQQKSDSSFVFKKQMVDVGEITDNYASILNASDFQENSKFLSKGAFSLISE